MFEKFFKSKEDEFGADAKERLKRIDALIAKDEAERIRRTAVPPRPPVGRGPTHLTMGGGLLGSSWEFRTALLVLAKKLNLTTVAEVYALMQEIDRHE